MYRFIWAIFAVSAAYAQSAGTATVVGNVTDSSGAIVPSVKVTVRNTGTQFVYEGETNEAGSYFIPNLPSGGYELSIEANGFKKYVQTGIVLRINEQPRFDVQLQVGNVAESIQVAATPPLIETETAGSGQILDSKVVTRLPVMQKFVHRVLLYMPGMTNINGQHAVGQRQRAIGYTMDGVNGKEPAVGQVGDFTRTMIASLDSIQEFKMWTTGTPAEFGHAAGGQLSTVFKSGANQFHGSFEDRYTNGKLIHRSYLEQLPRTGNFNYQEWGATASGRIKRDKTFFFGGFQQHYEKLNETFIGSVPSPAMYNGDFSFGGAGFPIFNPMSTRQEGATWVRDPFPNNQIPQSMFDPAARSLVALKPWREQTDPGTITAAGPQNNLTISAFGGYIFNRADGKIDHQFSSKHKIFGRYSFVWHRNEDRPVRELSEVLYGNVYVKPIDHHNVVISDSYTFSPTTVNEFRLGFNRRVFTATPESYDQNWAGKLGIPNVSPLTFPEFRNSTGGRLYNLGPDGRSSTVSEDFTLQENLTKVAGRHTFKMGYELIRTRYNSLPTAQPSGEYRMGGTERPFTPNTGNAFASLLLGTVVQGIYSTNTATWLPRWWQHSLYFQDTWRPVRNVTLELGVRWSYESPFSTKWGQQSQFDPTATDPLTGLRGAIVHGKGNLAKRDLNNFQPRIGVAWTVTPKTVFRGSFGAFAVDLMTNGVNQNFEEYLATANIQQPVGDPRHAFRLSQGPPAFTYPTAADGSVPFQGTNFGGRNASWFDPNMRLPYVYMWSAGIQRQLSTTWMMEVLYQGSAGVGLLNNWDINVVPLDISRDPAVLNQVFQATQNFKPFRQFGAIQHYANYGHNTHHSGTLRFERRFAQGMTLTSFYQLGKTINNADDDGTATGVTYYNRGLEKGRANYDIRHRFVNVMTYELPFGKGRKWMNRGGFPNWVLGGWDFAWTQTFQSGPPTTVTFGGSPNRYLPGASRPNQILPNDQAQPSNWDIGPHRFPLSAQNRYFSFDGFAYPAAFTAGTLGRNTFESPGLRWTQLSISKEFRITESVLFSIRWDCNNPTKEPQFPDPNGQFNLANRANFGTFAGNGRGSFSDIGTSRMHHIIVGRFQW
ncbi:MAG: carboxypeptidase regulatory-like domain-containing protein [Bryobacteraceae bacterium]|nr:carboxypeptidase regulatory-like domain-containing protein [Bryobacteraceae bacterium]